MERYSVARGCDSTTAVVANIHDQTIFISVRQPYFIILMPVPWEALIPFGVY